MKILVVSFNFPPKTGGLENVVFYAWKALSNMNDAIVIAPYTKSDEGKFPGVHRPFLPGLLFYFLFAFAKGFFLLTTQDYDVIMSGSGLTTSVTVILSKIFHTKAVTIVHGLDITYPNPFYRCLIKYFLPRNDVVIANSRSTKSFAIAAGVHHEKAIIIHPGVDYHGFQTDKTPEKLKLKYGLDGRRVILHAGRLARRKGALEFIRYCMPSIIKEIPDAMFLLVGANPSQSLAHKENMALLVENEIKKLKLESHVRMLGMVDQEAMVEYFNLCDIFVLPVIPVPGDAEGFGIVCIEASSAGKPVVATNIGGIPDSVENGKSGILLPPNDHKGLAREVISLLGDPKRRKSIGQHGKERVREKYDWEIIGNQYVDLFRRF